MTYVNEVTSNKKFSKLYNAITQLSLEDNTWKVTRSVFLIVKEITVNMSQNRSVLHKSTKICMKVDNKILKQ